jgi:hypothetical protein
MVQDIAAFRCQENVSNYVLLNRTWRLTTVFKKASQKNLSLSISTSFCALWYPFHIIPFSCQVSQVVSSSESFKPKCMSIYFFHDNAWSPAHSLHSDSVFWPVSLSNFLHFWLLSIRISSHITSTSNIPVEWETHTHGQIKLRLEFNLCIFVCRFLERGTKTKIEWINETCPLLCLWSESLYEYCRGSCLWLCNYKYKEYIVKHSDFIQVYCLHCLVQQHVSALVMSHLQVDYFS